MYTSFLIGFKLTPRGVKSRMCPPYPCNWSGVSESPYKKVGPVSVLGRARKRTLRNVYGVGARS